MKIITSFAVGLTLAGALSAASAQAQNVRTFVSGLGSDTNSCSIVAPCRTLQGALNQTNAQGEIIILDSAGYAGGTTVTINKAISIINQGGFAGVSVGSASIGIVINVQSGAVSMSGLTIDGYGSGATGIKINSGASVTIENCVIRNMTGDGIDFLSTTSQSAFTMSNSLIANNGGDGIDLNPTSTATAVFNHVEVNNNIGKGIYMFGSDVSASNTVNATLFDSVASGNSDTGLYVQTASGSAPTSLMVSHSIVANNTTGIFATGSGATVRLANSTVTGNLTSWEASSPGVVDSYGDNYIDGNPNGSPAPPKISPK